MYSVYLYYIPYILYPIPFTLYIPIHNISKIYLSIQKICSLYSFHKVIHLSLSLSSPIPPLPLTSPYLEITNIAQLR